MRALIASLLALALSAVFVVAQTRARTTLDIYVVDVEGGNATLFVAPSGESVLIDTGNGGAAAARDVGRIMAAVNDAGFGGDPPSPSPGSSGWGSSSPGWGSRTRSSAVSSSTAVSSEVTNVMGLILGP